MLQATRFGFVVAILATQVSCVSTTISSYADPAYADVFFGSVVVWADTDDLEWRQDLEATMRDRVVESTSATAVRMLDIAPPTRGHDASEMIAIAQGLGAEAVLAITFDDAGVSQVVSGNQYGVYTSEAPWANATATLVDMESGAVVWTGTVKTAGDDMTGWSDVRRSMGRKVIDELLNDGFLPSTVQARKATDRT